jgi:hypothetical protein
MAKLYSFIKSLGYLDSAKKVNLLINELKARNVKLTMELKARLVGKIQSKDALNCWRDRFHELNVPIPKEQKEEIIVIKSPKQTKTKSKNKQGKTKAKKESIQISNGRKLDPNSANYHSDLMKEGLRSKFKDYNYDLSDW